MSRLSPPEKIVAIEERLSETGIDHAFGGAFALAFYAEPRATDDIDINVFLAPSRWREASEALAPLGIEVSLTDRNGPQGDGRLRLRWEETRLDLFFSCEQIHERMPEMARRLPFEGSTLPVAAPEHLIVRKAILDRPKDWLDIERMLSATDDLDLAEVEGWLERMTSKRDHRLQRFAQAKRHSSGR